MSKRRTKGEGTIFFSQSEQRWIAEITLSDGRKRKKRNKDKQIVQDWLLEQRHNKSLNLPLRDEKVTVGDYLDRFMADVAEHTLKPSTIQSYRFIVNDHIKPTLGHIKLFKLHPEQIQHFYSEKLRSGLSPRSVQYFHSVLRRALNQAIRWGIIYRNPTDAVTPPSPTKQVPVTLSAEQVKLFLKSVKNHPLFPLYVLALHGMRKGEILGLKWESVDIEGGTLSVVDTLVTIQGKQTFGTPKSNSSKRKIILSRLAIDALKQHQKVYGKNGLVFVTSNGTPYSQRNITRHFHNTLEKIGLPKIPFHNLRHTCATLLLQKDVHPKIVQDLLGHASITLTLDTYSHVIPGYHSEAADKLDDIFNSSLYSSL